MKIRNMKQEGFHVETVSLLYYKNTPLERAVDRLYVACDKAYKQGANIVILSDRGVDENHVAIPSLLAVSAMEQYLIRTKKRTAISIILESAEPRCVHDFATLLGYGARAVNPYLAHECIEECIEKGLLDKDPHTAIDDYNEAELVAAKDQACSLGYFHAPAGRESEITNLAESKNRNRLEQKKEPGSRIVLPPGWDYNTETPSHPNAMQPSFKASMLRDIASGAGLEYANFANDWGGVTFSSVRAGTISERDCWQMLQNEMREKVLDRVFKAWLGSFLSLAVSGNYSPADYARLTPHEFRGRRWAWVDPMKDVTASVLAVKNGFQTAANIAADYGTDIDDNVAEAARLQAACEKLGVTLGEENTSLPKEASDEATEGK